MLGVKPKLTYGIDTEKCKMCDICYADFGCPAIGIRQAEDSSGIYVIDPGLCTQCGACASVCPSGAIVASRDEREHDEAL